MLIVGALPWASLSARVGEPQDIVERRLLQPNLGRLFFQSKEKETPAMERARIKEMKEQPFNEARVSGERESVYFWRLGMHFFFGGSSSP